MKASMMIVAGETSGDKHAALLVESLKRKADVNFYGIGGDRMKDAGVEILHHVREMSVMGFSEVLFKIPFFRKVSAELLQSIDARKPAGVILVDYPGFNLRFAESAKQKGLRVIYFISPQIWAWGRGRIEKIRKTVDLMLTVFKFEEKMYKDDGVDAHWVGHPLVDEVKHESEIDASNFRASHGLDGDSKILALLPGSRLQEIKRILPDMLTTARAASDRLAPAGAKIRSMIGCAPGISKSVYDEIVSSSGVRADLCYDIDLLLSAADAGIITSGTATLEAALHNLPIVVVYKTGWLNYIIGRSLVRLKSISLVNIVAGKPIVKEFVQGDFKPVKVADAICEIYESGTARQKMRREYDELKEILGEKGAADRAAGLILNTI